MRTIGEVVQLSKTSDAQTITGLNMLLEFPIGNRKVLLHSASVAPTAANTSMHVRIGYSYKQSTGADGSVDMVQGLARRYRPIVLNYPRPIQGPAKIYAAVLAEADSVADPFTFNVAYEVVG